MWRAGRLLRPSRRAATLPCATVQYRIAPLRGKRARKGVVHPLSSRFGLVPPSSSPLPISKAADLVRQLFRHSGAEETCSRKERGSCPRRRAPPAQARSRSRTSFLVALSSRARRACASGLELYIAEIPAPTTRPKESERRRKASLERRRVRRACVWKRSLSLLACPHLSAPPRSTETDSVCSHEGPLTLCKDVKGTNISHKYTASLRDENSKQFRRVPRP